VRTTAGNACSLPLPSFQRVVSVILFFTAPVTHQDQGTSPGGGGTPSALSGPRKSSVPCRVQLVWDRFHGFRPPHRWLTTWAVKSPASRSWGVGGPLIRLSGWSNPTVRYRALQLFNRKACSPQRGPGPS